MTRIWVDGLPVEVHTNKYDEPAVFILHERRYIVGRIIQRWEVDTDWWTEEGRAWRRHYALTTRGDSILRRRSFFYIVPRRAVSSNRTMSMGRE